MSAGHVGFRTVLNAAAKRGRIGTVKIWRPGQRSIAEQPAIPEQKVHTFVAFGLQRALRLNCEVHSGMRTPLRSAHATIAAIAIAGLMAAPAAGGTAR